MVYIYEDVDGIVKYVRNVKPSVNKVIELKRMIAKPLRQGYDSILRADFNTSSVWYELVPIKGVEQKKGLDELKKELKDKILAYDSSDAVNSFIMNGESIWLDKATRVGLKLRFDAEKAVGKTETTLWLDGKSFTIPLIGNITAIDILNGLELYASECYDNTQRHLGIVDQLYLEEDVIAYNFTVGYPKKLVF